MCVKSFLLVTYVKDGVYIPPLDTRADQLNDRITTAINPGEHVILIPIYEEFSRLSNVTIAAGGGHI